MTCDKCKKNSEAGRSFTWVVIPRTDTHRETKFQVALGATGNVSTYSISYGPLESARLFLCSACFSAERNSRRLKYAAGITLTLPTFGFFLYVFISQYSSLTSTDRAFFIAALVVVGFVAAVGLILTVLLTKRRGTDWEAEELLEPLLRRDLDAKVREHKKYYSPMEPCAWLYITYPRFEQLTKGRREGLSKADFNELVRSCRLVGEPLMYGREIASTSLLGPQA